MFYLKASLHNFDIKWLIVVSRYHLYLPQYKKEIPKQTVTRNCLANFCEADCVYLGVRLRLLTHNIVTRIFRQGIARRFLL